MPVTKSVLTALARAVPPAAAIVLSYLTHLILAALAALALSKGWHVSVPVIPLSLLSFTGLAGGKLAGQHLSEAWHTGRLNVAGELAKMSDGVATRLGDAIRAAVTAQDLPTMPTPAAKIAAEAAGGQAADRPSA